MLSFRRSPVHSSSESGEESAEEGLCGTSSSSFHVREEAEAYVDRSYKRGKDLLPSTWIFVVLSLVLEGLLFFALYWTGYLPEVIDHVIKWGTIALAVLILLIPVVAFVIRHQQEVLEGVVLAEMLVVVGEVQAALPRVLKTFFENEEQLKELRVKLEQEGKRMIKDSLQVAYDKAWEELAKTQTKSKEALKDAVSMAIKYTVEEGEYLKQKVVEMEERAGALISHELEKHGPKVWAQIEQGMSGELGQKIHSFEDKAVVAIQDIMKGDLGQKVHAFEDKARVAVQEVMKSELGHKVLEFEEKARSAIQLVLQSEFAEKVREFEEKARFAIQAGLKSEFANKVYEFEEKARITMTEGVRTMKQQVQDDFEQVLRQIGEVARRMAELERIIQQLPKQIKAE